MLHMFCALSHTLSLSLSLSLSFSLSFSLSLSLFVIDTFHYNILGNDKSIYDLFLKLILFQNNRRCFADFTPTLTSKTSSPNYKYFVQTSAVHCTLLQHVRIHSKHFKMLHHKITGLHSSSFYLRITFSKYCLHCKLYF